MEKTLRSLAVVLVAMMATGPLPAVNYTWTNTVADASGYWTNGVLWAAPSSTPYPGSAVSDAAYLTNQFSGTYTNILNSLLAAPIHTLAISNSLGEAWLVFTNGGSSPVVTNTTFSLGSGGRLQLDNGGVFSNTTTFNWVGTNGVIYLNQGGRLITARAAGIAIGSGSGGVIAMVTSVSGAGNGGIWDMTSKALTVGNATDGNVLRITGGAVVTNAGSITLSGNRNSLLVTGGGQLFGAGELTFNTANYGNTITLADGLWNVGANLAVGFASNSSNNTLNIVGGIVSNVASLYVGANNFAGITGANYNSVIVTNGGRLLMSSGFVYVGAAIATSNADAPGGGNNTVILSNSVLNLTPGYRTDIGFGSSNNTVTLLADTIWDNAAKPIWLGVGTPTYNNVLNITGGLLTNVGGLFIGGTAVGSTVSNRVVISQGGIVSNVTDLRISAASGANYNSLVATNGGRLFVSAGQIIIGSAANGVTGGSHNTLILSNSQLLLTAAGTSYLGSGSTNNSVSLLADTVVNARASALNIGGNAGIDNGLTLNGGRLTNSGTIAVGNGAGSGNFLIVTNGGELRTTGAIAIGQGGSSSNSFIVAGGNLLAASSTVVSNGAAGFTALAIGQGSRANTLTIDNAVFDNNGGGVLLGYNPGGSNNQVVIRNGGILTNVTGLLVGIGAANAGSSGEDGNSFIVTDGGRFLMKAGSVWVGGWGTLTGGGQNTVILSNSQLTANGAAYLGSGSSNNTLTLLANTLWNQGNAAVTIGNAAATGNVLTLHGGILSNADSVTVGAGAASKNNRLVITTGGQLFVNGTVLVGGTVATSNSVLVSNGGLLQANTLTIGAGTTGNTISNIGGIYQFTAAPTLNSLTPGDIALTDGTISFAQTGAANVTNTVANQLNKIRFAGANTFMLNNASNTTATVSQTYTFDTIAGNPSNYVKLVMVNGATAYGNVNGANITIGSGGAFLASNTAATIAGTFTGDGVIDIVDATVNFQGALQVAGTLSLQNGFLSGTAAKTVSGTLRGNGSVSGDVTVAGVIAPGFSLGTLVFSNDLTLTGSYQAEFGNAGSDQLIVVGLLTLSGATLELTPAGAATGEVFVIATYGSLAGDGMFSTTTGLPSGYEIDYNYNGGNQIAIVVVPEPSSIALVMGGLALLLLARRW